MDRNQGRIDIARLVQTALRRREEELTGLPYGTYKSPFVRAVTPSAVVKVEDDSDEEVDQLASDDPVAPGDGAVAGAVGSQS